MRRAALILLLFVLPSSALASTPAPELDSVASNIAGQALTVRCWVNEADDLDADANSWGYVYLAEPVIYLSPLACEGALALARGAMAPLWQLALGALTLTHEAYHLKASLPWERRRSEAQTECRAIKRVRQTALVLGSNEALAALVLPWAIAMHYKVSLIRDWNGTLPYNYPTCHVPVFADFWP